MPLLMCPNCNSSMQALNRSGVEFDMCPTCRGVWLDRGELEKIIEGIRNEAVAAAPMTPAQSQPGFHPQQPPQYRQQPPQQHYGERGEYGEQGEYGYGHKRKKRFDMFDIFD